MNTKKKNLLLVVIALICLIGITVGSTIAYVSQKTDPIKNTFQTSKVASEVIESFDGATKSNVKIKNTGDTVAYIRCMIVVNFVDKDGNVYGQTPKTSDYSITINSTDWKQGNDGFYYYSKPVAVNGTTTNLIDSATSVSVPKGCKLSIEIIASAIQSSPYKAVESSWSLKTAGITLEK